MDRDRDRDREESPIRDDELEQKSTKHRSSKDSSSRKKTTSDKEHRSSKDHDREKHHHRDRDKKESRDRDKKESITREKERLKDKTNIRDRDKRERERDRDKEKHHHRDPDRDRDKEKDRERDRDRDRDRVSSNNNDNNYSHAKEEGDVNERGDDEAASQSQSQSQQQLAERILKMNRKLEKQRVLQLSKILEEQDNIGEEGSEDEDTDQHTNDNLAGVKVKVLHGLDKVVEGGTVVLTIKDQPILADGDVNDDVDMLENVEIGEQKRRDDAYYKAAKKKTGIYDDDKFSDDEGFSLDERGRFSGEAEKKLEDLSSSSGKVSSDYYTSEEEMLHKFKKSKKKKSLSLRKKDKLDIVNALEAEAVSSGLGDARRRQAMKDEKEKLEAEMRNNAYQSAYAKADEASKLLLRLEQTQNVKAEEDETPAFADGDDEDFLRKSLEKARRLALKKKEEEGGSGPQAIIALLAASNPTNDTVDDQNPSSAGESQEKKVVFTEMEEFVWGLHIDEKARKPQSVDVFMHDDEGKSDEPGGWAQVKETKDDEQPVSEGKEEIVPDETIHEVAVGKGLMGALKLLKERGTLKESIEWGGRNMDKKKSKLVGIVDDEEIRIERTDEFGRILTYNEAFRVISRKFHGKGPGKMKQEKRMKQYQQELKMKQMKSSDTPSMSVERMREAQARLRTPYLVLSGHVKPGQTSDAKTGFATVEKDLPGGLTPMLGDRKVEHFLGIKRKAESSSSDASKRPKS